MSEKSPRRPSTLSVARAQANALPLGAPVPVRAGADDDMTLKAGLSRGALAQAARARPVAAPQPSTKKDVRTMVQQPAAAPRARGRGPAVSAARETQDARDRSIVGVLVALFVVSMILLLTLKVRSSTQDTNARANLQETFERVHSRQNEYHTIFGRFATWPELRERGVGVGPRQRVLSWNADRSHWFLSLRDQQTGVECDRTGELFDESASERLPVCRPAK